MLSYFCILEISHSRKFLKKEHSEYLTWLLLYKDKLEDLERLVGSGVGWEMVLMALDCTLTSLQQHPQANCDQAASILAWTVLEREKDGGVEDPH